MSSETKTVENAGHPAQDGSPDLVMATVRRLVLTSTTPGAFVDWLERHAKDGNPDPARLIRSGGRFYRLLIPGTYQNRKGMVSLFRVADTSADALRIGAWDLRHFNVEFLLSELGARRTEVIARLVVPQPEAESERREIFDRFEAQGTSDALRLKRLRELDDPPAVAASAHLMALFDDLMEYIDESFSHERIDKPSAARAGILRQVMAAFSRRTDAHCKEDVLVEIEAGETKHQEFKSSLRWNVYTEKNDDRMVHSALKAIAGFQNAEGGVLFIGVNDEGDIVGIEQDGFPNADKFQLYLMSQVKTSMGQTTAARITPTVWELGERTICRVECPPSPTPVYLTHKGDEKFYVRTGPATEEMSPSQMHAYVAERFSS